MDEQQMREVAEAAFKRHFGGVEVVRIDIRQGLDFEDDSPAVDVNIIYDDESGQVTGRGFLSVLSEVVDRTWREGKDDLGYPYLRCIAKSDIGQRDPSTI